MAGAAGIPPGRTALFAVGATLELRRSVPQLRALTITGLAQGAIFALFALGYTLVYGVLRLINFAHSEVFMVGTFAALYAWGFFGLDQNSRTPVPRAVSSGTC